MPDKNVPVVKAGDVTQRVGVEVIKARGVDVDLLIKKLIANAAAEFASTYYYYTILRMHLAGHEEPRHAGDEQPQAISPKAG